jgi:hypothetical protein
VFRLIEWEPPFALGELSAGKTVVSDPASTQEQLDAAAAKIISAKNSLLAAV